MDGAMLPYVIRVAMKRNANIFIKSKLLLSALLHSGQVEAHLISESDCSCASSLQVHHKQFTATIQKYPQVLFPHVEMAHCT